MSIFSGMIKSQVTDAEKRFSTEIEAIEAAEKKLELLLSNVDESKLASLLQSVSKVDASGNPLITAEVVSDSLTAGEEIKTAITSIKTKALAGK